jgi:phosphotriesterase-related protein
MARIQGVLGPLDPAALGVTLMHEHIRLALPGYEHDSAVRGDRGAEMAQAVARLEDLRALGVGTLVDASPIELGREPEFQREAAERSGLQVIIATGLYAEHGLIPGIPTYFKFRSVDEIADIYVTEIERGVGGTGIRAGIIKAGTGPSAITPNEENALRAAARAARATGVNITTHTSEGTMGPEQLDIFAAEGLDLKRVVIGHSDWSHDLSYHLSMLVRGCYLGFDTIGTALTTDELRAATLAGLVALGWAGRVVLSNDAMCWVHPRFTRRQIGPLPSGERRATHLILSFLPRLRALGVTETAIRQMTVDNPRRYFEQA